MVHTPVNTGRQRSPMTFWSKGDPVMLSIGQTDHWAKLRGKTCTHVPEVQSSSGTQSARVMSNRVVGGSRDFQRAQYVARMQQLQADGDGRVDSKGVAVFSNVATYDQHGNIPGNYISQRPQTTPNRSIKSSSFNVRAKEGFKYWYQERPKPTSFGRYGIGSYKTVLGLGFGPRT